MDYIIFLGRILFTTIFILSGFNHFTEQSIQYAASHGVPLPALLVPLSGIISILGGLSILLGYKARWGAWLIVLFLVPVTFMMHNFWSLSDPIQSKMQLIAFLKNFSLLGGALIITYFGSGPLSLDDRFGHDRGRRNRFF